MRTLLIGLIATLSCISLMAQDNETKKFDASKLEIGGTLGMSFGSSSYSGDYFGIQIMPEVGYRFSDKFSAGAGIGYFHSSWDDYSENYAGIGLYGRFRPLRYLSLNVKPQLFQMWRSGYSSRTVPCLLLGAGAIVPFGSNIGMSISFYYDVLRDDYSPYYNGWVYSIGFVYGF